MAPGDGWLGCGHQLTSAGDVTDVMTEPVFEIAFLLKALLHQLADEACVSGQEVVPMND